MLRTARLLLRPARVDDLPALHAILRDPCAMRYWSTPPHPDLKTTAAWLDSMLSRQPVTDFLIERDGIVIGKAGAWRLPEVGFLLHPDHWRQGIMREAMEAVLPFLWQASDVPFLTADVDPRNEASLGLLRALGFAETHRATRTFCIEGEWVDSVYLALARPENLVAG
ncbi:MAG: GNAT family N-acetyltransferase [Limimaricola sp.]|nr:GNAT family N-acetyltransferase [Limimaricola sp.]